MFRFLIRRCSLVWLLAGAITACDDSSLVPREAPADRDQSNQAVRLAKPPGLPKSWRAMTRADWQKHIADNGVWFPESLRYRSKARKCFLLEESALCNLSITPVSDAADLSVSDIAAKGVLLAVIVNEGVLKEVTLGLQPWDEVYWVAFRTSSGSLASALVNFNKGANIGKELKFGPCDGSTNDGTRKTEAKFQKCSHRGEVGSLHLHTSPPWISCAEGCCSSDGS